ncbi:MAG: DUF4097 domain-containing protein [candidate division KSB1 bacterium]|nr:DUF4097 domain-containing protein [candidate division KSB1 bacterium]
MFSDRFNETRDFKGFFRCGSLFVAKFRFEAYEIRYSQTERGVSIAAEMRGWHRGNDGLQVEFHLNVPKQYNLDLITSGGSIEVDGAADNLRAQTSGGGISLRGLHGAVEASTSGGSIDAEILEQIQAPCELSTSGGGITVYLAKDIRAEVDAHTSGGDVVSDLPITVQGAVGEASCAAK